MTHNPSILFVCLGNICRSPLAEAAFRQAADRAGLAVAIDSAGTGQWHVGKAPDPRARAQAKAHGVDMAAYRARQVEQADFTRFTHIFALDASNLDDLMRLRPAHATAHVGLLLDLVPGRAGQSVADPYYGGPEDFAVTWGEVSAQPRPWWRGSPGPDDPCAGISIGQANLCRFARGDPIGMGQILGKALL